MAQVTTAGFTGEFKIVQDTALTASLEACIAKWEPRFKRNLFGKTLAALYEADLASPTARFSVLTAAFSVQEEGCKVRESEGIVPMLKALIYAKFLKQSDVILTPFGLQKATAEATTSVSKEGRMIEMHNTGVRSFKQIQWYMRDYLPDNYTEYDGRKLKYASILNLP